MKECKECKRTEVIFWSLKHLTCVECIKKDTIRCRKSKVRPDFKSLIKKKRADCSYFILKPNKDDGYHNDLGCTYKKIRGHIEKQFAESMTWENHGAWHIDHIIPLSSAKSESQLIKLLRWQNIQPLWAEANLRKSRGKLSQEKRDEINKKMSERCNNALKVSETGIIKTRTIREMFIVLKDFNIVSMHDLEIYAKSIGYEKEGDLFIKRRKL